MARWPYSTKAWAQTRAAQLSDEPLCRMCKQIGTLTSAEVVDHIVPVNEAPERAFDPDNLQSLCKRCHDRYKQAQERGGGLPGSSLTGAPLDPRHHWHEG